MGVKELRKVILTFALPEPASTVNITFSIDMARPWASAPHSYNIQSVVVKVRKQIMQDKHLNVCTRIVNKTDIVTAKPV